MQFAQKCWVECLNHLDYLDNIIDRPFNKREQSIQNLIDHMPKITFKEIKDIISSYETNKKIT